MKKSSASLLHTDKWVLSISLIVKLSSWSTSSVRQRIQKRREKREKRDTLLILRRSGQIGHRCLSLYCVLVYKKNTGGSTLYNLDCAGNSTHSVSLEHLVRTTVPSFIIGKSYQFWDRILHVDKQMISLSCLLNNLILTP